MRLKTLLAPLALLALACGRGSADDSSMGLFEESNLQFNTAAVSCNDDEWEFSALTTGAVSVVVHVWQGESDLGDQDLAERGQGNWFAERTEDEVGGSCLDGDNLVEFIATDADGDTVRETR